MNTYYKAHQATEYDMNSTEDVDRFLARIHEQIDAIETPNSPITEPVASLRNHQTHKLDTTEKNGGITESVYGNIYYQPPEIFPTKTPVNESHNFFKYTHSPSTDDKINSVTTENKNTEIKLLRSVIQRDHEFLEMLTSAPVVVNDRLELSNLNDSHNEVGEGDHNETIDRKSLCLESSTIINTETNIDANLAITGNDGNNHTNNNIITECRDSSSTKKNSVNKDHTEIKINCEPVKINVEITGLNRPIETEKTNNNRVYRKLAEKRPKSAATTYKQVQRKISDNCIKSDISKNQKEMKKNDKFNFPNVMENIRPTEGFETWFSDYKRLTAVRKASMKDYMISLTNIENHSSSVTSKKLVHHIKLRHHFNTGNPLSSSSDISDLERISEGNRKLVADIKLLRAKQDIAKESNNSDPNTNEVRLVNLDAIKKNILDQQNYLAEMHVSIDSAVETCIQKYSEITTELQTYLGNFEENYLANNQQSASDNNIIGTAEDLFGQKKKAIRGLGAQSASVNSPALKIIDNEIERLGGITGGWNSKDHEQFFNKWLAFFELSLISPSKHTLNADIENPERKTHRLIFQRSREKFIQQITSVFGTKYTVFQLAQHDLFCERLFELMRKRRQAIKEYQEEVIEKNRNIKDALIKENEKVREQRKQQQEAEAILLREKAAEVKKLLFERRSLAAEDEYAMTIREKLKKKLEAQEARQKASKLEKERRLRQEKEKKLLLAQYEAEKRMKLQRDCELQDGLLTEEDLEKKRKELKFQRMHDAQMQDIKNRYELARQTSLQYMMEHGARATTIENAPRPASVRNVMVRERTPEELLAELTRPQSRMREIITKENKERRKAIENAIYVKSGNVTVGFDPFAIVPIPGSCSRPQWMQD